MKKIKLKIKDRDIKKIEKRLGVTLMAKKADDTVNGHINFIQDGSGYIAEIHLYDKDEAPTFKKYKKDDIWYATGRKTTIKKVDSALQQVETSKKKGVI